MNAQIKPHVILASASIGRKTLLEKLGVPFTVMPNNIDEDSITGSDHYETLKLRARAKAEEVVKKLSDSSHQSSDKNTSVNCDPRTANYLIVAADSEAVLNGKTYGKARDKSSAKEIVQALMGKTHEFVTATCIILLKNLKSPKSLNENNRWENTTTTRVTLRTLDASSLDAYISRYDFTRFAAGYALNETPWDLVTKIDGSVTNVIGLPFEVILPIFSKLNLF